MGASTFKSLAEHGKLLSSTLTYEDRGGRPYSKKVSQTDFRQLKSDWDNARWQLRKSEVLQHAEELNKALDDLTKKVNEIASTLKAHLPPLTTPT
jgi:hypothetical protein